MDAGPPSSPETPPSTPQSRADASALTRIASGPQAGRFSGFPILVAATCTVIVGLALVLTIQPRAAWSQVVGDTAYTVAASIASYACVKAARRGGDSGRGWGFLGVGMGLWAVAAAVFTAYGIFLDHKYPFPSIADVGFLGYSLPVAVGLLLLPRRGDRLVSRLRVLLDGLVIAVALLFVSWATVLGPLYQVDSSGLSRAVGLAYPIVDVLIASLVIALGIGAPAGTRLPWIFLGGGLLTLSVTDSLYASETLRGMSGITGTPIASGWTAAFLLVTLATRASVLDSDTSLRSNFTVTQELLPYAPVLAAVVVTAQRGTINFNDPFLLISGLLLVLLIVAHQVVIAVEKVALANDLELTVVTRTGELADLARRSELILDSAGEGIYGVDRSGSMTFANPAASEMLGYSAQEMLGRSSHDLFHASAGGGSAHPIESCPVTVAIRTGDRQHSSDDSFQRKDGSFFAVEKIASPIHEGARVTGAVVTFRDITKRREVDRMKTEFTSVVSHELRTPLTSIRGSLGLLASGALGNVSDKGQRMLDIAVSNTDRLVRLINDILDIERIESGSIAMDRHRTNAGVLMCQARDAMEAMAGGAGVTVGVSPVEIDLWADPDRIMQMLTNLVSNAIKFSPRGGTVHMSAERRDGEVLFSIRDEGRGIPADRLEAVFERFQQVDSSDAREKGGTGLGLPICRSIVEQHGGRIWVESTLGEGSEFFFTLPVPPPQSIDRDPAREGAPAVLVCDDDASVLEVVSTVLQRRGYRAIPAASGEQALELAAREQPAAILLDLLMPGMSGWETAAKLTARPETKNIPIVICSVLAPGDNDVPADADVVAWLDKPVDDESMVQALQTALLKPVGASRVLVIEDDPDLAHVLTTMFERHGVETFHAETAGEALEISRRLLPDLVVLDLMLPDSDGFAVVEGLRRDERLEAVPLVVYTARDLDESERARLRLGETHLFTKGRVSPQDFEQHVMRLVTRMTRQREVALVR